MSHTRHMSAEDFIGFDPDPVAAQNFDNVQGLFRDLRRAADTLGVEQLAADLHMTDDVQSLEDILEGRADISLGELQVIAIALDSCVSFRVFERASDYLAPDLRDFEMRVEQVLREHSAPWTEVSMAISTAGAAAEATRRLAGAH